MHHTPPSPDLFAPLVVSLSASPLLRGTGKCPERAPLTGRRKNRVNETTLESSTGRSSAGEANKALVIDAGH